MDEPLLAFREVYYDDSGAPAAHGEPFMCGGTEGELRELLVRLGSALSAPTLSEGDFVGKIGASPVTAPTPKKTARKPPRRGTRKR